MIRPARRRGAFRDRVGRLSRSDQGGFFPVDFTNDACKLGVNYIVYGMTH